MDPNLDDTETIMKRYEENDIKKELDQKAFSVGSDLSGGIDKIAANSFAHNSEADNTQLRKLVEGYLQHGFAEDGMPNGKMTLEKWNAQLAAEEALKSWNTLSEAALDKFMKDNFDKSWTKFDSFDRG